MSGTDTAPVPMSIDSNKENSQKNASLTSYQLPWVEKYRPRTLDDVLGNSETVERLRSIAKEGNVPNLILCGPPGTGKTTSVHALARELLGSAYKNAVLELNASDARGIDVSLLKSQKRYQSLTPVVSMLISHTFCHQRRLCGIRSKVLP